MGGLAHRFEAKHDGEFLLNYDTAQMLASAKQTPMLAPPGTDWSYSDQGYFLLGLIIEEVTRQSFFDYLKAEFFAPMGMTQTAILDQSAIIPNLAQGYIFEDEQIRRGRRVWQFGSTAHFGVLSSLNDMLKWEAHLSGSSVIREQAVRASWEIQRHFDVGSSCQDWGYARGWWSRVAENRVIVDHTGYSGTAYIRDIGSGLSVIVLTNREVSEGLFGPMKLAWAALNAVDPTVPKDGYRCWE